MSEPRGNLIFTFECPYCGAKHQFEREDHPIYYYESEIRWSDFSHVHTREKLSNCGSCNQAFTFQDIGLVRRATYINAKRTYRPWEANQLDCIRKRYFSNEGKKIASETAAYTIAIQQASNVLESGNYPSELERSLRLLAWVEYNTLNKNEPTLYALKLPLLKRIQKKIELLSTKLSNAKRARLLRQGYESNLERLLELNPTDVDKLEIYRSLGMFTEAKQLFDKVYHHMAYDVEDWHFWTFYYELKKRIKRRNKKVFGLMPTFKVV